jgi:hypothetical protein
MRMRKMMHPVLVRFFFGLLCGGEGRGRGRSMKLGETWFLVILIAHNGRREQLRHGTFF